MTNTTNPISAALQRAAEIIHQHDISQDGFVAANVYWGLGVTIQLSPAKFIELAKFYGAKITTGPDWTRTDGDHARFNHDGVEFATILRHRDEVAKASEPAEVA